MKRLAIKPLNTSSPKSIDKNGNALIKDDEHFYLYHIPSEITYIIPEVETGVYTKDYALSQDGNTLVYTDRDLVMEGDKYATQYLYRLRLGDYTNFETAELHADADAAEKEASDMKEISLHENNLDEIDEFNSLWESSKDQLFPTKFPGELEYTTHHFTQTSDGSTDYSMSYYIYFNDLSEDKINYSINPTMRDGTCLFFDDLEVAETVDGIDYLYYEFDNSDREAAVSMDDICYHFETDDDFTKDELLNMAKSLEPIDEVFHEIPLDEIKLLKKLPIQSPDQPYQSIISYHDGESVDFIVEYSGNQDDDIRTEFEIRNSAPNFFEEREENINLDIDGFEEAYYLTDYHRSIFYDGNYYYVIELDIKDKDAEALGHDYLEELFIEMAESLE